MAATAMFVEVLVVGIGFLTGLCILTAAIAGPDNTRKLAPVGGTPLAAGAALAFAYALLAVLYPFVCSVWFERDAGSGELADVRA
ncbi:hypothetical protein ACPCBE_33280 [Streptomyces griseoincarnatus]